MNRKMMNRSRCTVGYSQYSEGLNTAIVKPNNKAYSGLQNPLIIAQGCPWKK